ncbi:MAG: (2Fe-2S)-binding protein [Actinomycetota bacterium]
MSRTHITCTINGEATDFLATDGTSLLDALRDELGLTGAKEGCGTGDCGACSVLVDGRVNCSCLMFAPEAEGRDIVTVEGLAHGDGAGGDQLHPLQQTFLEGAALQCGVCTPGFLVAAKALLDENPEPTETEIRYALAGNLCRCTGYDKIIRSVQEAAVQLRTPVHGGV